MKKWLFLLLLSGMIVGCGQQGNEVSSEEQDNLETEKQVMDETKPDSMVAAEVSSENDETETNEETTTTSNETESESEESPEILETSSEPSVDVQEIDIQFIKDQLNIGMTEQEVINLIGEPHKSGIDSMNSKPLWLYNIRAVKNYYFESQLDNPELIDSIDTEGLENKEVDIILFLLWDKEKVNSISAHYLDGQGNITEYRLLEDGTVKK